MTENIEGFGYTDAMDVERKEREWVINELLPKGFGFIAGLPKAGNSPHGGKSVLTRMMAWSLISGEPFLGFEISQPGDVLMVNLDESQHEIAECFRSMIGGTTSRGLKLTNAHAMVFPDDFPRLENDLRQLKPGVLIVDPLLRCVGGKDIKESQHTGPILNGLKKLQREHNIPIIVVHHCIKSTDRDKESTPSWLNGSIDLDSAWDFCLCLDWNKKPDYMHLRCFYRGMGRKDVFYLATKDGSDKIIGLELTEERDKEANRNKIFSCLDESGKTVSQLVGLTDIPESTLKRALSSSEGKETRDGKILCQLPKRGKAYVWALVPKNPSSEVVEVVQTPSSQPLMS